MKYNSSLLLATTCAEIRIVFQLLPTVGAEFELFLLFGLRIRFWGVIWLWVFAFFVMEFRLRSLAKEAFLTILLLTVDLTICTLSALWLFVLMLLNSRHRVHPGLNLRRASFHGDVLNWKNVPVHFHVDF